MDDQSATNVIRHKMTIDKIFILFLIFSFLKIQINSIDIDSGNNTLVLLNRFPSMGLYEIPRPKQNAK